MNILEINLKTLSDLYEQFPESFKDLSMNGNYLVYKEEQVRNVRLYKLRA